MLRTGPLERKQFSYFDFAAIILGAALFSFFALTAKNGVSAPDESFYYSVVQRLFLGEKLIADEWNIAQLVHLLNVVPYFVFTHVSGGTEGIILFMRCLFIGIDAVFYAWVYAKLRKYGIWGLAAALCFCAVIVQTIFAITYFSSAPMAMLAFCLLLITDDRGRNLPVLLFCGVLLACAVLAEPYLIAGFALWFFTVVLREAQKKRGKAIAAEYGFILDARVFSGVTAGVMAVFLPFMAYMVFGGSFARFTEAFPYLASGGEIGKLGTVLIKKCADGAMYFGLPFTICQLLALGAAITLCIRKNGTPKSRKIVFAAAAAALAGSLIWAGIKTLSTREQSVWTAFAEYHDFAFLFFSPVPFLLSEKKNPRLTAFWAVGAVYNVLVDASSAVILGSGGGILRVACLLQFSSLLPELFGKSAGTSEKGKRSAEQKKTPRLLPAAAALCAAAALMWHTGYVLCETVYKPTEKMFLHANGPLTAEIGAGPFRGLRTTPEIADVYARTLEDLDTVKTVAAGRPAAVLDVAPYTYLYMGLPYGAYTAWFEFYEPERLAAYWALRPAQTAAVIYLPYNEKALFAPYDEKTDETRLALLEPCVKWELVEGKAGYILTVTDVRLPELPDGSASAEK